MGKSHFKKNSNQIEQYLSGIDRAQTAKEIAEGLGITNSSVYTTLQLMEVFGTVQKVKRRGNYYLLKGIYDDEQISAMLPPERVKPKPQRRRSILQAQRQSEFPVRRSFLDEHLFSMRAQASSVEGPMALAMIGLTQETIVEEALTVELPRALEVVHEHKERKFEAPKKIEPFATVGQLPKDARRINSGQMKYLKEQLRGLDGFEGIERFTTAFTEFSALKNGSYGTIFYFSMGTNPWERIYRVTVDVPLSHETKEPVKKRGRGRGRSKYDPILDQFIELGQDLVEIAVKDKDSSYIASQLKKRIKTRELEIIASSVSGFVYLEHMHRKVKETGTPEESEE